MQYLSSFFLFWFPIFLFYLKFVFRMRLDIYPNSFLSKIFVFNFFIFHNSYLCNQLGNALFCVTSGIFAGRAQRDPAKSHELPTQNCISKRVTYKIFSNFDKKKFLQTLNEVCNEFH
jgi:hypothetical protein